MIDLTPLDVRKKKGDFARGLRGYDPQDVDQFLDLVSERLEGLVKENLDLQGKVETLSRQVRGSEGREKAVQEALITAQELREEIRDQARREAELLLREAESEAQGIRQGAEEEARKTLEDVDRALDQRRQEIRELTRARQRFMRSFRHLLEREMDALEAEEARDPLEGFSPDILETGESAFADPKMSDQEEEAREGSGRGTIPSEEVGPETGKAVTVSAGEGDSISRTDRSEKPSEPGKVERGGSSRE